MDQQQQRPHHYQLFLMILCLFATELQADKLRLSLGSKEVVENCNIVEIRQDTLIISTSGRQRSIHLDDIERVFVSKGSTLSKYDFRGLSKLERKDIVQNYLNGHESQTEQLPEQIAEAVAQKQWRILLLLSFVVILTIAIIILLKFRKGRPTKEPIPGVEAMAKTAVFWSEWHEGKQEEEQCGESPDGD